MWCEYDTLSILTKAVLYFKYLLSENVSLLILWNSVKQLGFFFCHKATASKQKKQLCFISCVFVMLQKLFVTIPAKV